MLRLEMAATVSWYYCASLAAGPRSESPSLAGAAWSPPGIFCANATSAARVLSGYMLMSRRYWSREPSSYDDFLGGVEAMRVDPGDDGPSQVGREGVRRT